LSIKGKLQNFSGTTDLLHCIIEQNNKHQGGSLGEGKGFFGVCFYSFSLILKFLFSVQTLGWPCGIHLLRYWLWCFEKELKWVGGGL